MSPFAIIAFRVGTVGVATATILIVVDTHFYPPSTTATAAEQRLREFFKPLTKRYLRHGQEMRTRW
ncbi:MULTISPECIES: entry exclusion protein TrbK [Rhizobium]|uniref:entry exclusion protein TrbK n=1 Tax=Rhizobium TaxID=379 RepID=UPI00027D810C|nr:entry exclusion protein TrbK [Rhizobium redzepovicii]MBY4617158.1 entry exclusion protein TrbK [Rhizobium redzepovicii]PDS80482.1 entry exclusion protein TrbK [Rhizobium sp. L18]TBY44461.1 entry exclusion protein TrbK [Rhizobium leguminosarum bv. viciae]